MSGPREPTLSPLSKYEREERNATVAREGKFQSDIGRVAEVVASGLSHRRRGQEQDRG